MDILENKETLTANETVAEVSEVKNEVETSSNEVVEKEGVKAQDVVEEETAEPNEVEDDSSTVLDGAELEAQKERAEDIAESDLTREHIVEEFAQLLTKPLEEIRERAEHLKSQFYKLHRTHTDATDETESAENVQTREDATADSVDAVFKNLLQQYKDMKAEAGKRLQEELAQNQLRKENIIEQMKQMSEDQTVDVQENLKKFKELQAEWKTIGAVPPQVATQLWKSYNLYQEKFYDLVKINYELRDYDFKRNLDLKTKLCEQAEQLKNNENVVEAFRALQQLHEEWANIGPVSRELREEIWNRFKEASSVINKRHQEHFENIHQREEENLQNKLDIIEQLRAIDFEQLNTSKKWDEATQTVTELQAKWRSIGFAPKKHNQVIYDEYRALCDEFYSKKTAFYRELKDVLGDNLQKKRSLLERAEALKDSEEWQKATDEFVRLQQEWKKVGPVARKYSDDIWKRFQTACDSFFERKKAQGQSQRDIEKHNLELKRDIIKQIDELEVGERQPTLEKLYDLMGQFAAVGHVPFRDKEKIYRQYRTATDKVFDALHVQASERRLDAFVKDVEGKSENQLLSERNRLVRQYENLQQEIQTAENNILFFTSKSGKGNQLVDSMQKKIDDLRRQLSTIEGKVNVIDKRLAESEE